MRKRSMLKSETEKFCVEKEAGELFGIMREPTAEETQNINEYIDTISEDTGVKVTDEY